MIDINKISSCYSVKMLGENDADSIVDLCKENALFYKYTEAKPNKDEIINDMKLLPPGKQYNDKYYIGFYDNENLIAIMDLIDGWPSVDIAYIGFFIMNINYQGKNIGSSIINELSTYLKSIGKKYIRLAIDDDNPQSMHFWIKNGFNVINKTTLNGWIKHVAQKELY